MDEMFAPGKLGRLDIKNRIVRSATYEGLAYPEGRVTPRQVDYLVRLAKGEVGLLVLGITAVDAGGKGMSGMTGIYSEDHYEGHARLVEAVHEAGARISIQLAHVGAQADPKRLPEPVGPSAILHPAFDVTPRELSTDEVKGLVDAFGRASDLAARAGYDAIQIHGAHGYLVDQFMSPRFNRRRDEYGDPKKFVMDVYRAVNAASGSAAVHIKLNIDDFLEGSTTAEVSLPIARALDKEGISAIEVSSGTTASGKLSPSRKVKGVEDEAYFLELARQVKKAVKCPVIGVGGFRSPEVINRVLSLCQVDFVALSRPLIREPGLIRRWKEGDLAPARCESCNRCFATEKYGEGIQCMLDYRERIRREKEDNEKARP